MTFVYQVAPAALPIKMFMPGLQNATTVPRNSWLGPTDTDFPKPKAAAFFEVVRVLVLKPLSTQKSL